MTTTPNPTPDRVVAEALHEAGLHPALREPFATDLREGCAGVAVSALRAAGLLVGDPAEEQIEAVARELACLDEGDPWPTNAQLGGVLTGDRDMEYRSGMREQARDLLLVAARAAGVVPQAYAKPLATSPGRVKNEADSCNVAPQELDECGHEAWEETGGSRRCSDCKEWLGPQESSEPTYSPTTGQWSSYCPCIRVEQVDPECEWHGRPEFRRWVRGGER